MRTAPKLGLAALAIVLLGGAAVYRFVLYPESATLEAEAGHGTDPKLPAPNATLMPTVNVAKVAGWKDGATPRAAQGLAVNAFAKDLVHPRWLYVLPNGDVLVAETNKPKTDDPSTGIADWVGDKIKAYAGAGVPSPDRIVLLRDKDGDGTAEERHDFLKNLTSPFGMALVNGTLYVANADSLVSVPYQDGQTEITASPQKLVDLPSGNNHHWTKNILATPDGQKLYVTVGSNSNVGENGLDKEEGRARIDVYDIKENTLSPYATGMRNPNGLAIEPKSGALWAAVNERDEIGSDLVPDYVTSVKEGAFYGWPWSYWGQHVDERVQPPRPDMVQKAIAPDYAVGTHTASLGIAFSQGAKLPEAWTSGLFVAQHGSWNRRPKSGYKVLYVPFKDGKPSGKPVDALTGFLDADEHAQGRPVDVAVGKDGALLVTDDVGKVVWRVSGGAGTQ